MQTRRSTCEAYEQYNTGSLKGTMTVRVRAQGPFIGTASEVSRRADGWVAAIKPTTFGVKRGKVCQHVYLVLGVLFASSTHKPGRLGQVDVGRFRTTLDHVNMVGFGATPNNVIMAKLAWLVSAEVVCTCQSDTLSGSLRGGGWGYTVSRSHTFPARRLARHVRLLLTV